MLGAAGVALRRTLMGFGGAGAALRLPRAGCRRTTFLRCALRTFVCVLLRSSSATGCLFGPLRGLAGLFQRF